MGHFIVRRLLWIVFLLFVVSGLTFLVFYVMPAADPAALRAGRQADPELIAQIRENLGLDDPLHVQYLEYMKAIVLHFDFGYSYEYSAPVRDLILDRLPATVSLALGAAVVWLAVGVTVGVLSAVKRGTKLDRAAMGAALLAVSAPVYWLGLIALYLFSLEIGKIPLFPGSGSYEALTEDPSQWFASLILPWLVLAAAFAAIYARLLRSNLLDTLGKDYIRTARAKGLSERAVVLKHGMRSAVTPIVTLLGIDLGVLLGGVILTETVFDIPGMGRLAYDAILRSDLPVIQGTVLFGAFFIVALTLVVDIVYAFLDPRVRY